MKAWIWICSEIGILGRDGSIKCLLSLSLGPQQNNAFQHKNTEEGVLFL